MIISLVMTVFLYGSIQQPAPQVNIDQPNAAAKKNNIDEYYSYIDKQLADSRKDTSNVDCIFKFTDIDYDKSYSDGFVNLIVAVVNHYQQLGLTVMIKADPDKHQFFISIGLYPKAKEI